MNINQVTYFYPDPWFIYWAINTFVLSMHSVAIILEGMFAIENPSSIQMLQQSCDCTRHLL